MGAFAVWEADSLSVALALAGSLHPGLAGLYKTPPCFMCADTVYVNVNYML